MVAEIPLALQLVVLLVAIAGGIAMPFALFILADLRARLQTLEEGVRMNGTHTATHAAQLVYISESIKALEKRRDH